VVAFFGQFASNAAERFSHVYFLLTGRIPHHKSTFKHDFRCSLNTWSLSASVTSVLARSNCWIWYRKFGGSSGP
jgi:hypothetical protein